MLRRISTPRDVVRAGDRPECCRNDTTGKTPGALLKNRGHCPVPPAKIFIFPKHRNHDLKKLSRAHYGGRFAIVTTRGAGCDGRIGIAGERFRRVRSSRVVLSPRRWRQVSGDDPLATGANKPGTPAIRFTHFGVLEWCRI